jgi:hypothetical protein
MEQGQMNVRDQVKNILVTLWPKSKLPPEVLTEIVNRLATCRLPIEQIDAMLRGHRFECDKANWSPFPPDIFKRINAIRNTRGVTKTVDKTAEAAAREANEMRWAAIVNTDRKRRVITALECMEMSELDAFVKSKISGIMDAQAEFAAEMWEDAKARLGKPETWTPERVANCQAARVVLCRCLNISLDTPRFDPERKYLATLKPAGTDRINPDEVLK